MRPPRRGDEVYPGGMGGDRSHAVQHVSVYIARRPVEVYEFASDPRNLPRWAAGLARSVVRREGDHWIADAPFGKVGVRFVERNPFGVMDHDVTLESGITVHNSMRVVPNGEGSEFVFTLIRRPAMSDEQFAEDRAAIENDLRALKALLESRSESRRLPSSHAIGATLAGRDPERGWRIVDLTRDTPDTIERAAVLLRDAFHDRTEDWQDLDSARREVMASLAPERIRRVAVAPSGEVLGWVGGIPAYGGRVWELHPLVVAGSHRRQGIGRALVQDLERIAGHRGGVTLWLGSDDENDETSLGGIDLYADVPGALRRFTRLRGEHPCDFYVRLGFRITGVMPDANGPGKPDIFFAKRVEASDAGGRGPRPGARTRR